MPLRGRRLSRYWTDGGRGGGLVGVKGVVCVVVFCEHIQRGWKQAGFGCGHFVFFTDNKPRGGLRYRGENRF
jgi:hypothetical protein